MIDWLFIIIFAYFLFAVVSLVDRYLLKEPLPHPKVYAFCVGALGLIILIIIPFGLLESLPVVFVILGILAGFFRILGLLTYYSALKSFEVSRIVPALGGILPIFTFFLAYFFIKLEFFSFLMNGEETGILGIKELFAFFLLIAGSVLIVLEKSKAITLGALKLSGLAAFFLAFSFFLSKLVYISGFFISGLFWILMGSAITSFFLLLSSETRNRLFKERVVLKRKTLGLLLFNQALGGTAVFLQNFAIFLAPLALLALVNALEGIRYVFLLAIVCILSLKFPKILKEEISKEVLFQKILAIILIGAGILLLV